MIFPPAAEKTCSGAQPERVFLGNIMEMACTSNMPINAILTFSKYCLPNRRYLLCQNYLVSLCHALLLDQIIIPLY